MSYLIGFVAGIATYSIYRRLVILVARRFIDRDHKDDKVLRGMLFAKMSYDGLLRVKAALETEFAKRREPLDG